jgi:hypothetical protein
MDVDVGDAMDVDDEDKALLAMAVDGSSSNDPAAAVARLEAALLRRAGGQQPPPPPPVDPSLALISLLEMSGAANAGVALDRAASSGGAAAAGAGGLNAAALAAAALAASSSTTAGGGGFRPAIARAPAESLPQPVLGELRARALVVNELLRHLWACIPANTPAKQQKVARVKTALEQQYDSVTRGLEASAPSRRAAVLQLSRPLMEAMDRAFDAARAVEEAVKRREKQQAAAAAKAAKAAKAAAKG